MLNPYTQKRWLILVVDGSRELVSFACDSLKSDYDTITALNGIEAIEQYNKERPDLIILEVEECDGYEVCHKIKEISGRRFTPVIFISNNSDIGSIKKGLQCGAEDYLSKPFHPEELFVRVQATLRTKNLHTQLMKANEIIENERNIIAQIQQDLICESHPVIPGLNFYSKYQPSSKASGDYFDLITIDDEHLGVLVADVSGHGTPAAVIMAMKRILLRSFLSKIRSPRETLDILNKILCDNIHSGHFITAFYGVIHLPTRMMKYSSAGHNPPIYVDYNTGNIQELWAGKGFPLMILPDNKMEEHEVQLLQNSKLILYTDGLTEARNPDGVAFGAKRFSRLTLEIGEGLNAEELGAKLMEEVLGYMSGTLFHDDFTLMVVELE